MRWLNFRREDFIGLAPVGRKGAYQAFLSPNSKNLEKGEDEEAELRAVLVSYDRKPSVMQLRESLKELQKSYDEGREVNSFLAKGRHYWLSKADRVGLKNSLELLGEYEEASVWLDGQEFKGAAGKFLAFLKELELYAMRCYQATQEHLRAVNGMDTIDELLAFDVTTGYPEMVKLDISD